MSWRGEDGRFRKGTPQEHVSAHVEKVSARHPELSADEQATWERYRADVLSRPVEERAAAGAAFRAAQFPQAAISKPKPSPEPHWPSALIWLIALAGLALIGLIVYIAH